MYLAWYIRLYSVGNQALRQNFFLNFRVGLWGHNVHHARFPGPAGGPVLLLGADSARRRSHRSGTSKKTYFIFSDAFLLNFGMNSLFCFRVKSRLGWSIWPWPWPYADNPTPSWVSSNRPSHHKYTPFFSR